jgi:hypothetical protein
MLGGRKREIRKGAITFVKLQVNTACDLVSRILAGDPVAETELFERYSNGVRLMLLKRTGCQQLSNDICQEAMIVTLKKPMDPTGRWLKLPVRQLSVLELDRFKIYRAIAKLEDAGIVKSRHSPGRKTLYRLMPEL